MGLASWELGRAGFSDSMEVFLQQDMPCYQLEEQRCLHAWELLHGFSEGRGPHGWVDLPKPLATWRVHEMLDAFGFNF